MPRLTRIRWRSVHPLAVAIAGWLVNIAMQAFLAATGAAAPVVAGVVNSSCPRDVIALEPGTSIQAAVEHAGDGAAFCLRNGVHRMQAIRPKSGQSFHGEGRTVLNGSRLLTTFGREGRYWVSEQEPRGRKDGLCEKWAPTCNLPEALFIDDQPLVQVLSKDEVETGRFYFDRVGARIYFIDDPTGRKVELTVAAFAFEGRATNVLIRNVSIEKYASPAQRGAIQARHGLGWVVENCELRWNSGGGIAAGPGTRVRGCDIHDNGQIGVGGGGRDVMLEGNRIWANNIRGFDAGWEAGGVKIALGDDIVFRGNHVHDNLGPGLWCDGDCRNVLYENNVVERNHGAGIFHEISFNAVIRNNIVSHNGIAENEWFWGSDILIAASQDVDVYGNTLAVSSGKCGIMLIDQGRNDRLRTHSGPIYKTRNNSVHDNEMTFDGVACAGGVSDVKPGHENFSIITDGNNLFDGNVYRAPRMSGPVRFVWGHSVLDWEGLRGKGVEPNGELVRY
jgi:parallel beta-helix repeat protein